jgi:hypothetical protein
MRQLGQAKADQNMLDRALDGLAELSSGRFAERMRIDAASRLLVTVHRVLRLRAAGMMITPQPRPAQRRAMLEVERICTGWNPASMTATEFVSDLPPADVKLLMELSPVWADVVHGGLARPRAG